MPDLVFNVNTLPIRTTKSTSFRAKAFATKTNLTHNDYIILLKLFLRILRKINVILNDFVFNMSGKLY